MSAVTEPSQAKSIPGDRMEDGTIFAGISPDTGRPIYTTPSDARTNRPLGPDKFVYTFKQAMDHAAGLDAHGHKDWRVPTKAELSVLFNNRASIGEFDMTGSFPSGWYWSSTMDDHDVLAWAQRFSDEHQSWFLNVSASLRCVRG